MPDPGGSGVPEVATIEPTKGGAVAAMLAAPTKYAGGILEVTGQDGAPNPKEWVLQAWNTEDPETLHKLTVLEGQLFSDTLSANLIEIERREINIPIESVRIDSGGAWRIARAYAEANSQPLGHVNYSLTAHAKRTPPIWTLECFDPKGGRIGKLEILASTGEVVSHPGFKATP